MKKLIAVIVCIILLLSACQQTKSIDDNNESMTYDTSLVVTGGIYDSLYLYDNLVK